MLKELLNKYLGDEAKVTAFMEEMKQSKIFTTAEENIDKRYSKLKTDFDSKTKEHQEALNLIEQLKTTNAGNEALQGKITEYENTIATLQQEKIKMQDEADLKMMFLSGNAKPEDVDYLMYRMNKSGTTIKKNDKGEITNKDEILKGMQKNFPSNFKEQSKREVEVQKLPNSEGDNKIVTKEQFDRMSYRKRLELNNSNPELYNELSGNKE